MRIALTCLSLAWAGCTGSDCAGGQYRRTPSTGRLSLDAQTPAPGAGPAWYTPESFLESSEAIERGLELLERLKVAPHDREAQEEYAGLLGEVQWASEEDERHLSPSKVGAFVEQPAAPGNSTASCNDPTWAGCNGLSGDCCPASTGEYLACCAGEPAVLPPADAAAPTEEPRTKGGAGTVEVPVRPVAPAGAGEVPMLGEPAKDDTILQFNELIYDKGMGKVLARLLVHRRDYAVEAVNRDGPNEPKFFIDGESWSLHGRMYIMQVGEQEPAFVIRRAYNYLNPVARMIGQYTYRIIPFKYEREGGYAPEHAIFTVTKDRFGRGALWLHEEWRVYYGDGGCSRATYGVLSCRQRQQVYYSISEGWSRASWATTFYKGNIRSMSGDHRTATLDDGTIIQGDELLQHEVAHAKKTGGPKRALRWAVDILGALLEATGTANLLQTGATLFWADVYDVTAYKGQDSMLISSLAAMQDVTRDLAYLRPV
mmetsp:Transcript_16007/g.40650  ORF Transcript_16007/g.40650 Transcript_16007/m.40650 type:complete len:485 (-) Transcript_16007:68-1522(-)